MGAASSAVGKSHLTSFFLTLPSSPCLEPQEILAHSACSICSLDEPAKSRLADIRFLECRNDE